MAEEHLELPARFQNDDMIPTAFSFLLFLCRLVVAVWVCMRMHIWRKVIHLSILCLAHESDLMSPDEGDRIT